MSVYAGLNDRPNPIYDFSGSMAGTAAQALLPIWPTRKFFLFQNGGSHNMYLLFGGGTATCALTSGAVSSVTVVNAGLKYTYAPQVIFMGGGYSSGLVNQPTEGVGLPFAGLSPSGPNAASAHCNMTGSAGALTINTITVDNGGSGYIVAPYVYLQNDPRDPVGCAAPSATSGILVGNGTAPFILKAEFCTNIQVAVYGTSGDTFTCYAAP